MASFPPNLMPPVKAGSIYNMTNKSEVKMEATASKKTKVAKVVNGTKEISMWASLNDKDGNSIGEVTLKAAKVDYETTEWQESFWRVVRLAGMANSIPTIVRSNEDKFADLSTVATLAYSDIDLFVKHYQQMAYELTLSPKFAEDCNDMHLDVQTVAQHIVFDGELMYATVKEFGTKPFYRNLPEKFDEPIFVLS